MKKGISPLIAAVILIAFVIAVAGIASAFFTDTIEEWTTGVEEENPIDCSLMDLEILSTNATANSVAVDYRSMNTKIEDGVSMSIYNQNGNLVDSATDNATLEAGNSNQIEVTGLSLSGDIDVELASLDCSKVTAEDTVTV